MVGGHHSGPFGAALVISVAAPAVDGRATEAARRALAAALKVRRSAVVLRRGAASRDKLFAVTSPGDDGLASRIAELRDSGAR
ncbi:DUF167 domain-containing protein [Natronosporangium hydrolyticum]|uniref:DUF167 domain-containing protein n=2 Tax=Natronosporangium hydrolyticum TaxID=2811111 RepID=A0A895YNZ2_9ACTN|nr:DUF167 domain-containing protein [Natronosporangium hydrolyticum]